MRGPSRAEADARTRRAARTSRTSRTARTLRTARTTARERRPVGGAFGPPRGAVGAGASPTDARDTVSADRSADRGSRGRGASGRAARRDAGRPAGSAERHQDLGVLRSRLDQRYTVTAYCRVLYSLHTGRVASRRGALDWAYRNLEATYAFAAYAESFGD
ncbi:aminoglycoside adenylyltransferase domain-containing protein [Streptomyces sp. NPDC019507]|uniref:aminoglycoside adenylyltransferase domain-containing protein n=1 Tax=Streptomyces sp. NPDC019507 TaxID=3154689 RepID=UPI00340D0A8C